VTEISSEVALAGGTTAPRISRWRTGRRLLLVAAAIGIVGAVAVAVWIWRGGQSRGETAFAQARAALDRQEWATVRQLARELHALPGHQPHATFLRGALLLHKGHYYPAVDELEQVKEAPQVKLPALLLLGQAWYHLGRQIEAQAALEEVLKHEPNSLEAHRWLAASYYDQGAIHDAIVHLVRTAELDPLDPRPDRLLGLIYKDYERYEDAVTMYEESLRRKSDQPAALEIRHELAECQLRLRRHRDALATLEHCPQLPALDAIRAEYHYAIGETELAKETLARAIAAEPDNLEVSLLRATILLDEGQAERAAEILNRAALKHPHEYMLHFKLAQAYAQSGKPKQAETEQKLADEIREIRKEFADLHQAAWDRPDDAAIRLRLAELAGKLGRPDLADVWLKSAAALAPIPTPSSTADPPQSKSNAP
jgi:tetratricopeptide (TPR) repeat protein